MSLLAEVHPDRMRHLADAMEAVLRACAASPEEAITATGLLAARIGRKADRFEALMVGVAVMMRAHREAMNEGAAMASGHPEAIARATLAGSEPQGSA